MLRSLLREYASHLTGTLGAENMNMARFEEEVATLPPPYKILLLALVDAEAAGCVLLKPLTNVNEMACELKRLWVRPQFRGLSLGRRLTESAMSEATQQGYVTMYLDTVPLAMEAAHRIYERLGFVAVDRYNDNPVGNVKFFRRAL